MKKKRRTEKPPTHSSHGKAGGSVRSSTGAPLSSSTTGDVTGLEAANTDRRRRRPLLPPAPLLLPARSNGGGVRKVSAAAPVAAPTPAPAPDSALPAVPVTSTTLSFPSAADGAAAVLGTAVDGLSLGLVGAGILWTNRHGNRVTPTHTPHSCQQPNAHGPSMRAQPPHPKFVKA